MNDSSGRMSSKVLHCSGILLLLTFALLAQSAWAQRIGSLLPDKPQRSKASSDERQAAIGPPSLKLSLPSPAKFDATVPPSAGGHSYYFPHLAVGAGWQTTLTYINYSPQEVSCRTEFLSDQGTPLMVSFPALGPVVRRTDVMPPGGSVHQETNVGLSAPLAPGWARATCSGPVKASLLFRRYNSEGVPTAEAGVNATTVPATRFVTFAEQGEGQFGTGVAYANPSDTEADVTFTAKDAAGQTLASTNHNLPPGGHGAQNMVDLFGLTSFIGSLQVTSTEPIVSLSLNFEADPVFSFLPPGELDPSAEGSVTYYFPHLAVGASWQTTITYINYASEEVSCQTDFLSDDGSPLMVSFAGLGTVVSRTDVLPPGGSVHQETNVDLSAPLAPGWSRANCSGAVKASLLFRRYDSEGVPTGEASVNAAAVPAARFVTFAEQGEGQFGTGVAYANPSSAAADLSFTARDAAGQTLASVNHNLLPGGHGSQNMVDLFGLTSFSGSLEVTSTEPIVSLSLNFEADPVFSSLPPGRVEERTHDPGTEPMTDREVLEVLYHATNGPEWNNHTNWLSEAPLSEWYGVGTDGSGRVTSLRLPRNGLRGPISPALGRLIRLDELYLPNNQLSGAIPPELGQLTQLQELLLAFNQLSGAIPPELGNLTNLQTLWLRDNQLSGSIPAALVQLSQLKHLTVTSNRLNGAIPAELGQLTQLQSLSLGFNQLSGAIPPELGQLTQLQSLSLDFNQLSGAIPAELGQLTQLQHMSLGLNQLSGTIPSELGGLTQLGVLSLGFNQLSGPIPPELGGLTQLHRLGLWINQLTGAIPAELGQLTQLQDLNLLDNQLSGRIPPELGGLTKLQRLKLGVNGLSGPIPPELSGLSRLEDLTLRGNLLTGALPLEFAGLTQLQRLDLAFNQDLTGMIPTGFRQLPLSTLDLMATSVCVPGDAEFMEWLPTIEFTSSGLTCGSPAPAMSEIDIAVFYTPAARKRAGGTIEIEAVIDLMIAEANQVYVESGVNQRLVLVAREEVEYTEGPKGNSGNAVAIAHLASASDGYMDEVHAIRDQTGADLVHLLLDRGGGIAYVPGAFGVSCAGCGFGVFVHELGHNMGLLHDRYDTRHSRTFPYGHGYVNQRAFEVGAPKSARWLTIMAVNSQCFDAGFSCDSTTRFSDPDHTYRGDPMGVPGEERTNALNGPSDAVRTLNIMRHSIASFRPRASVNRLTLASSFPQGGTRAWGLPPAQFAGGDVFRAIAPTGSATASQQERGVVDQATLRRREVSVDIGSLARAAAGGSNTLRLNLFDDMVLIGIIERRTPTYSGGYALSARLAGVGEGRVTLVVNGSVVAGTVRLPGATYRIRPEGARRHAILQIDPSKLPHGCDVVSPRPGGER